jgi:isopropylmalate/homocitrate/citramalate synthase
MTPEHAAQIAIECLDFALSHQWKLMFHSVDSSEEQIKEALSALKQLANGNTS